NAVGGVVIDSGTFPWLDNEKFPSLSQPVTEYNGITFAETFGNDLAYTLYSHAVSLRDLGSTMSPFHAWLTLNGVETLALRMERHCENAQRVAEFLHGHPQVDWVSYAGLPDNSFYPLASKYLEEGAGSVFTFGIKGGYEAGVKLVELVELHSHVANIGDTRSLIIHPASTTHRQLTDEQRVAAGAGPEVIRLSVGLEQVEDIINDLDQAFQLL
ncbi:MAG TPA: bifunctional O-acetylhomoserine aminocarboxypropyltransferase/cysteine synthase, partial [Deltaproteobacteria bacterium]|nr:bifunctional O-acetylhomoserine aminocarboxypropyltransferase/cysteine synthase [Deltaproteobacteria bacterium]